jgi:hypothetical protein
VSRCLHKGTDPLIIAAPAIDGDIVVEYPTFQDLANPNSHQPKGKFWCQELLIGAAQDTSAPGMRTRIIFPFIP